MTRTLLPFLLLCLDLSAALRLPVRGRQARRSKRQDGSKVISVDNQGDTNYLANVTMGGANFEVTIDTGSSDLWVQKPVPNAQTTKFTASVNYAVGEVTGPVKMVDTTFSGFTVKNQAYIEVPPGGNNQAGDSDGLIGLGPSAGSQVLEAVGSAAGNPFLDNVFRQDTSSPNIITVLLSREGDSGVEVRGEFSVGAIASGFDSINSQPKLPIVSVPLQAKSNQHWTSLVDGIIGPDGQKLNLQSSVPKTPSGKLVAVYDSGFTFPQLPKTVADAIYSSVPGASFDRRSGFWLIPCQQEVNLTFIIGGQNFPIHPFDTGMLGGADASGNALCQGAFQPITTSTGNLFDMILGMAFLRNAYMLINFGDFVEGNPEHQGDPFMQLLPTTDPAKAHAAFVQSRLNGVDTTGSQVRLNTSTTFDNANPNSSGSDDDFNHVKSFIQKNWVYFAAGGGGLVALILGCCLFSSIRNRNRRRRNAASSAYPVGAGAGSYKPLHDPAPGMEEHYGSGSQQSGAIGTYGGGPPAYEYSAPPQSYQPQPYHASGYGEGGRGYVDPYGARY